MQDVQKLALIFMQPFYLHVKYGARIYLDSVVFFYIFSQTHLILVFDIHKLFLALGIIRIYLKIFDMGKVRCPFIADLAGYPLCQHRIAVKQESSLGDTIGLIIEFLRHHLVKIMQFLIL